MSRFLLISFFSTSGNIISQTAPNDTTRKDTPLYNNSAAENSSLSKEIKLPINNEAKKLKSIAKERSDLNNLKKQLLKFDPHGTVSVGYEYGVLPYVYGNNFPASGFKTEGDISFSLMKLPLQLNFYYTNIKNVIGLNNYFRISYDANKYSEQLKNELGNKKQDLKNQIGDLKTEKQKLGQKIAFYEFLEKNPDYNPPLGEKNNQFTDSIKNNKDNNKIQSVMNDSIIALDSIHTGSNQIAPGFNSDSLKNNWVETKQEKKNAGVSKDSIYGANRQSEKKDSISRELNKYVSKYDSINQQILFIKGQIEEMQDYENYASKISNPYLSKAQQILSGIKKFEIGLCNPSSSTFLVNNIPLQGINIEYEKKSKFLTLAYGTTVNNLLFNPRTIDGIVQGSRNYYNYFDFGNLEAGRKILMIKGGTGTKESSHLFIGALLGKGQVDYAFSLPDSPHDKESNLVLEIDGKYNFNSSVSTELVLGKSSLQQEDISSEQLKRSVNEIFSNYRSNALFSRTTASFSKTKTNIALTLRWIDPYFKSLGLGFLRSDNFRYEIKTEQSLTRKIKYTIAFRREEDNLLQLYNYKNILYSINNSLNLRLTRKLNVRLIYVPLFRKLRFENNVITDKNQIATAVVSWFPKAKKVSAQYNGLYSRYMMNGDSTDINFETFTYTHQLIFKSGFKTDLNITWFKNNISDTLGNNTYLGLLEFGYVSKKSTSISIGGKIAYKIKTEPQYGFVVKSRIHIYKNLSAEAEMAKIIIGDYYNTFDLDKIKQFPYYCKAQLSLNF